MTREESLSIITEAIEDYVCNYVTDTAKAQKMLNAIQTLEQEPCEDAISRQAVIDAIYDMEILKYRIDLENVIKALPSVKPQEKTGHWVKTPKAVMGEGYMWYCDKCEHQVYQDSSKSYPSEKYCPNCGTRMVEEQESEVQDADSN